MRVIAGEYGGRVLKSPQGLKTRPTSDRLRETLFNILNPWIDSETRFLDLCAGTGAIGIEAISRGAGFTTFVDKSRRACGLIEENLDLLKIPVEKSEIICGTSEQFLRKHHKTGWQIIFFDPPYECNFDLTLNEFDLDSSEVISEDCILIVEHHFKTEIRKTIGNLSLSRVVKQGETSLSIFKT